MQNKNTRERTKKLPANENRLKQNKEKLKQYHQNRDFVNSLDRFHNELQETSILTENTLTTERVE